VGIGKGKGKVRVSSGFEGGRCNGSDICYDRKRDTDVQVALDGKCE